MECTIKVSMTCTGHRYQKKESVIQKYKIESNVIEEDLTKKQIDLFRNLVMKTRSTWKHNISQFESK